MTQKPRPPSLAFWRPTGHFNAWRCTTAAAALVAYALIWVAWARGWAPLEQFDAGALGYFHNIGVRHPAWVQFWHVLCEVLAPMVLRVAMLVPIVIAWRRGQRSTALFLTVTTWGSLVVVFVAKLLAGRPRPHTALVDASGTSFPSGHAAGDLIIVWAVLAVALPLMARQWRAVVVTVGVLVVVTVGVARVVLNVHHPSDVMAGWLLGYAYMQICWMLWRPNTTRERDRERPVRRPRKSPPRNQQRW